MAAIRRLLLGFCTIIGSCLIKPVQNVQFSPITVDLSMCTTARMTTAVVPDSKYFRFDWILINGSRNINLALIQLDGNGNVRVVLFNNDYRGRYEIVSEPSLLDPPNAPFNSTLVFMNLSSVEKYVFSLPKYTKIQSENVSRPGCRFPNDSNCMSNCFNEILCDNNITKQCSDSKSVVQECPVDVSTAKYNPCGDEANASGSSAFITAGVVAAIVVVIVICSIYAFRIYSARTHTVDDSQKLARNEEVPGDNYDQ